jgi:hypothetical protein
MKKPKGQIFLMSILILSVVLTAGMVLMAIFIKDLKQSTETSASAKAFYAADSAMEWQLYKTFVNPDAPSPLQPFENGASCCSIGLVKNTYNEATGSRSIQTIGVVGNVRRGIEVNFTP